MKRIFKDHNFLSLATNGASAAFGLVTFMLLARFYSTESFGLWVLYLTSFSFVEMLKAGIIHTALVKFLSGKEGKEYKGLIGSSWVLSLLLSTPIILIIHGSYLLFADQIASVGLLLFFKWYPLLSIIILPFNYGNWVQQARLKFGRILLLRILNPSLFLVLVLGNLVWQLDIEGVVLLHLSAYAFASLFTILKGWSGVSYIRLVSKAHLSKLFHFGKYSLGTLLGTNLLKSADALLIGFFLGPAYAALYSIPVRLTEMIEIPLRGLVSAALPRLAKASNANDTARVRQIFYEYAGVLTLIFIPFMILAFVFAEELVLIAGGEKYLVSADIFRIFTIYGLFLSIDRFTGVTLDAINKPNYNLVKVILMASANAIGDLVVILFIGELWAVAMITILNVITGVVIGWWFLNGEMKIRLSVLLRTGWQMLHQLLASRLSPTVHKSKA
ncbi:MAG: oligosaccharide flippase family protein [Bacteroidota bacterium]